MARSRDKAAEEKAYEEAVVKAALGEKVNLEAIRVLSGREQAEFNRRVAERQRASTNQQIVREGKLTLAKAGQPTRTSSDILRGAVSSRNILQQPASVQKYVRTAQLNSDFNQGRIGVEEYKRRLAELNEDLAIQRDLEQNLRDRTSVKQAQSAGIKQREQRAVAASQGVAVGTIAKDTTANISQKSRPSIINTENLEKAPKPPEKTQREKLNQTIIGSSGEVLGTITGKSKGAQFSIFQKQKEVEGPPDLRKQPKVPQVIKTAFYTFDERQGPQDRRVIGPTGSLDFTFGKPKTTFISESLDRLSESAERLAFDKTKDPVSQLIIGGGKFVVSVGSSIYNISGIASQGLEYLITGKTTPVLEVKVPQTVAGEYLGAQIEGISKAVTSGNQGELLQGNEEAKKRAVKVLEKQGGFVTVGEVLSETVGLPLRAISPVKVAEALIPAEKGVQRIGTTLSIGYGKLSTPLVSRVGGRFGLGSGKNLITRETVSELFPSGALELQTGRGVKALELASARQPTQSLLTSTKGLQSLVEAGKILPSDVTFLKAQQKLAELAGLAQKKISPKELVQTETLPRGIFEGVETVAEEEKLIEDIVPKTRPVKGSQIFFTQLRQGLRPLGLKSSDIDVDYIGGLLGDRYATNRATQITRQTVESLNEVISQRRAAVASGTKVFVGKIIEGVVFKPSKLKLSREQLEGGGEKLAEFLTKKDADEGTSSIINDVSKIFNVKKSRKTVKVFTGYTGLFGKKFRKEIPLPTQLLNQIASATRIQTKSTEIQFRGGTIPFLKKGFSEPLYTSEGFRVGSDLQRFKDIVRQQPVALQLAELLEGKGYGGKIQEVKLIFEDIKKAKPELDFDAAFQGVEKTAESYSSPSIINSVGSTIRTSVKPGLGTTKSVRPSSKTESKTSSPTSTSLRLLDSIASVRPSRSTLLTRSYLVRTSSRLSKTQSKPPSVSSNIRLSRTSLKPLSNVRVSRTSLTLPSKLSTTSTTSSSVSPYGIETKAKSPPTKSIGKVITKTIQPIDPFKRSLRIGGFRFFKFDQIKKLRLPSQSKRKFFIAGVADPLRAGVFAPKGVKELRSSKPIVFRQIDVNLAKARRNKKAYDPLNSFKIAKSGKYVYSSKNLLNSYTKIKI